MPNLTERVNRVTEYLTATQAGPSTPSLDAQISGFESSSVDRQLDQIRQQLYRLTDALRAHRHSNNGEVLVPYGNQ